MPNDPMNPDQMDATTTTGSDTIEQVVSDKNPKLVLIALGVILAGLTLWGAVQLSQQTVDLVNEETGSEVVTPKELTQEEMIRAQLDALAADDAANQVEVTGEEIQAQLEALAADDAANQVEVTQEEVQAQLEALAAEEATLEVR